MGAEGLRLRAGGLERSLLVCVCFSLCLGGEHSTVQVHVKHFRHSAFVGVL